MKRQKKLSTPNNTLLVILFLLLFIPLIIYINLSSKQDIYQQAKEATQSAISVNSQSWENVHTDQFRVKLPQGWHYQEKQGIDSFIGEFNGEGITITFDYGWYSDPLTGYQDADMYNSAYEVINQRKALIVSSKNNPGVAAVHFENIEAIDQKRINTNQIPTNKLTLYAQNLTPGQQQVVLQIFKTIEFTQS